MWLWMNTDDFASNAIFAVVIRFGCVVRNKVVYNSSDTLQLPILIIADQDFSLESDCLGFLWIEYATIEATEEPIDEGESRHSIGHCERLNAGVKFQNEFSVANGYNACEKTKVFITDDWSETKKTYKSLWVVWEGKVTRLQSEFMCNNHVQVKIILICIE